MLVRFDRLSLVSVALAHGLGCGPHEAAPAAETSTGATMDSGGTTTAGGSTGSSSATTHDTDGGSPTGIDTSATTGAQPECDRGIHAGNVVVESKADLEALRGFTEIAGDLQIVAQEPLGSLEPLSCLQKVSGTVTIALVPDLIDLHGLEQLGSVGALGIGELEKLQSLKGLNVTELLVGIVDDQPLGSLAITMCPLLEDLEPLASLKAFKTWNLRIVDLPLVTDLSPLSGLTEILVEANIAGLPLLKDLSGLSGLQKAKDLRIAVNESLVSLAGLENLQTVPGRFEIESNPQLVDLDELSGLQVIGGDGGSAGLIIFDNDSLVDIDELLDVSIEGSNLHIRQNASLSQCAVEDFVAEMESAGFIGSIQTDGNKPCP